MLVGNQVLNLAQMRFGIVRLLLQHLTIEALRLIVVPPFLRPTRDRHQVIVVGRLHQQRDGLWLLTRLAQTLRTRHQHITVQARAQLAHGLSPLRTRQLFQRA